MLTATIGALTFAVARGAPVWIAGWIIVLALIIGISVHYTRKRRNSGDRPPR